MAETSNAEKHGKIDVAAANQDWFWTNDWQAGERKVDEYINAGVFETFDSMEEFLSTLESEKPC
jgi:hypothetical protein